MAEVIDVKLVSTAPYDGINFQGGATVVWYLDTDGYMGTVEAFASAQRVASAGFPATGDYPLPKIGDSYQVEKDQAGSADASPYLKCTRLNIERRGQAAQDYKQDAFTVTGTFSTIQAGSGAVNQPGLSPVDPDVRQRKFITFASETRLTEQGWLESPDMPVPGLIEGNYITLRNAVGKELSVSIYKDTRYAIYVQEGNVKTLEQVLAIDSALNETVNNADFSPAGTSHVYPKHHVRYLGLETSEEQQTAGQTYYRCQLKLAMRKEVPWYEEIPNRGIYYAPDGALQDPEKLEPVPNDGEASSLEFDGTLTPDESPGAVILLRLYKEVSYAEYQDWDPNPAQ